MIAAPSLRSGWRLRSAEALARRHARAAARNYIAPPGAAATKMEERKAKVSWSGFRASCSGLLDAWADTDVVDSPLSAAVLDASKMKERKADEDEDFQCEAVLDHLRGAVALPSSDAEAPVFCGYPLNPDAKEFACSSSTVLEGPHYPSIGAQLDAVLQELCRLASSKAEEDANKMKAQNAVEEEARQHILDRIGKCESLVASLSVQLNALPRQLVPLLVDQVLAGIPAPPAPLAPDMSFVRLLIQETLSNALVGLVPKVATELQARGVCSISVVDQATSSLTCSAPDKDQATSSWTCSASDEATSSLTCSASDKVQATSSLSCSASDKATSSWTCSASDEATSSLTCSASDKVQATSSLTCSASDKATSSLTCSASDKVQATSSLICSASEKATSSLTCSASDKVQADKKFGEFEVGDVVVIHGLTKSPEHNLHTGIIVGFAVDTSRFIVDLIGGDEQLSGKTVRVKVANLLSADEAEDMIDVEAAELASPPVVATDVKDKETKILHPFSGVASDEFSTMTDYSVLLSADDVDEKNYPPEGSEPPCEWQPSPPLSGAYLGPSRSMTAGRQT